MTTASPVRDAPHGSAELDVQVVPRASHTRVVGVHGDRLKIQLAAPPVDGAANAALIDLLADELGVPASRVEVVRGHTGRRKTLRIAGLPAGELRRLLGLPLALALLAGCESRYDFPITVVLPEDSAALERADNAALRLEPQGIDVSYEVDGLEFSLELQLEPDAVQRTLSLYLADGEDLLAWGRSAPFVLSAPPEELALYVSPPGELSVFPGEVAEPDPELLVAVARGRGALLLDPEGRAALFNEFTLDTEIAADLDPEDGLPAATDGALVPDRVGNVWRLAWAERLRGYRYEPGSDAWTTPELSGDPGGARPGAAHLVDASFERVLLFGGGELADILQIDLLASEDGAHAVAVIDPPLDGPRRGATAHYVVRADGDEGEGVVLVGGDDPARRLGFDTATGVAFGPAEAWTGLQCAQVDLDADADASVRVLCLGGLRGGAPTTSALVLHFPAVTADKPPSLEIVPDFTDEAPQDPRLFADAAALYAQFGAQWLRIDRGDLATLKNPSPALRVRGGHSVLLGTGATFLLGGFTEADSAVDRWHVFVPTLDTTTSRSFRPAAR